MSMDNEVKKSVFMTETDLQKDLLETNIKNLENDVIGYLKHITSDSTLALDLAQESMLRAIPKLCTTQKAERLKPYVLKIARNLAIDHFRRSKIEVLQSKDSFINEHFTGNTENIEKSYIRKETKDELVKKFNTLKHADREIITLYYYNDLNLKEISRLLEIPINTVITRMCRARSKLKSKLLKGNI